MDWIYLDNNATTRPLPEVVEAVSQAQSELWANPSSVHRFGQMVRQRVELARLNLAKLVGVRDRELILTSGGTESNNLALRGVLDLAGDKPAVLITTPVEHSAVREPAEALAQRGADVRYLAVAGDGRASINSLKQTLADLPAGAVAVVSVMWANNETGVLEPIEELAQVIAEFNKEQRQAEKPSRVYFHSDATQAVGKLPIDFKQAGLDLASFSAHKFHGPKGVGALYVRTGVRLRPQQRGGPQERDRRGGTENTAGVIGAGVAAEAAAAFVQDAETLDRLRGLRDQFEKQVLEALPGAVVNSSGAPRLWNTSNIAFPRLEAEAILLGLSERGVCASAGAACSSGSLEPSPVLLAMGLADELAHGSVRFSIGRLTGAEELERAVGEVAAVVRKLGRTLPMGA